MPRLMLHESITIERVTKTLDEAEEYGDHPGFCTGCGDYNEGVDPDGRECECETCGELLVYGAQELLLMMVA